jgi:hypothetical protein
MRTTGLQVALVEACQSVGDRLLSSERQSETFAEAVARRKTAISLRHQGQWYSGSWRLEGNLVCVTSSYGSKHAALGDVRPSSSAEALFREVIAEWRPQRSEF